MSKTTLDKLMKRLDAIELERRKGPLFCVCGTVEEGREALEKHRADHPQDGNRDVHIIATGIGGVSIYGMEQFQ